MFTSSGKNITMINNFNASDFSRELAIQLLQSRNDFPVDFDDAMNWWDCRSKDGSPTRKDQLVRKLRQNFELNIDYTLHKNVESRQGEGLGYCDKIFMTIDTFKEMGMMLPNGKGREIRRYFLDCERELKQIKYSDFNSLDTPSPQLISDALIAVFRPTDIDPKLISGIIANNIAKTYPALSPVMEDAKKNLVVEITEQLLTPTEIGHILEQRTGVKHSGIKVNKILAEKGLQQPNPDGKEPAWLPIGSGVEFSKLILSTQKGPKDAIRQQLKWYPSIVEQLV